MEDAPEERRRRKCTGDLIEGGEVSEGREFNISVS